MVSIPVFHRHIAANIASQALVVLIGIVAVPLYIRYLGIEAYGVIGLFTLLQSMLVLLDLGMSPTLMREISRFTGGDRDVVAIRDLLRSVEIAGLSIAVVIAAGLWIAAPWLAVHWIRSVSLPVEDIERALRIVGFIVALRFIEGIFRSAVLGLNRQQTYNIINLTGAALRAGGAVFILSHISNTLAGFFLWQVSISLIIVLSLVLSCYVVIPVGDRGGRFSTKELLSIWKFAAGVLTITMLSLTLTQLDKLLLSRLLTLREYAFYVLAGTAAISLEMLASPIIQALSPRLSKLHAQKDDIGFIELFHQAAQLVSVLIGSAAIVIIIFADVLLIVWTHDPLLSKATTPLLRLLAIGYFLNILMWVPYQAQLAYRWTSLTIRINIFAVALLVPLILWSVPRYGATGAALAWAGLNGAYFVVNAHFMHRKILQAEKWRWYYYDIFLPLISITVVIAFFRWSLSSMLENTTMQVLALFVATGLSLFVGLIAAPTSRSWVICTVQRYSLDH